MRALREVVRDASQLARDLERAVDVVADVGTHARLKALSQRAAVALGTAAAVLDVDGAAGAIPDDGLQSLDAPCIVATDVAVTDLACLTRLDAAAALFLAHAERIRAADAPPGLLAPVRVLVDVAREVRFEYEMWG